MAESTLTLGCTNGPYSHSVYSVRHGRNTDLFTSFEATRDDDIVALGAKDVDSPETQAILGIHDIDEIVPSVGAQSHSRQYKNVFDPPALNFSFDEKTDR